MFFALVFQEVNSSDEVLNLLRQGNANRRTEATGANQVSSRSHAVLQVNITYAYNGRGSDGRFGGSKHGIYIVVENGYYHIKREISLMCL